VKSADGHESRGNHDDLPILLLGRGGATIRPGRYLRYAKDTPLANLYLGMLHRMGVTVDSFGDGTGEPEGLS